MQRYVNESASRHGIRERNMIDQMRAVGAGMVGRRLLYRDLIAEIGRLLERLRRRYPDWSDDRVEAEAARQLGAIRVAATTLRGKSVNGNTRSVKGARPSTPH